MARLKSGLGWALVLASCLVGGAQGDGVFDFNARHPEREIKADYFGTHIHRLWARDAPGHLPTPWPEGEIGAIRLWDSATRWADIEPEPGQFDFERLDFYVASAERHHAAIMLVLGSPPRWASARPLEPGPYGPGSAAEPGNMALWDRYVTAVARRYKGRIAHYELWNEPFFAETPGAKAAYAGRMYFTGSVHAMVELARRARIVLDHEDPAAVLLTPGATDGVSMLDLFLAAGGATYVGGITYHYYVKDDQEFLSLHRQIRETLARRQLDGLPIFNTESGFPSKGTNAAQGALLMARQMILGAFVGLDRYYQYAWDNGETGFAGTSLGPLESRNGEAYATVRRWLLEAKPERCRQAPEGIVVCELLKDGARRLIVWKPAKGASATPWHLPQGLHAGLIERVLVDPRVARFDHDDVVMVSGNPVTVVLKTDSP
ncbi:MAG TPA: hypothetical protein VGM81_21270 [Burkholderiaceae bacterium]|jgi:hypothetical protein